VYAKKTVVDDVMDAVRKQVFFLNSHIDISRCITEQHWENIQCVIRLRSWRTGR
jgi:hypothetical protein